MSACGRRPVVRSLTSGVRIRRMVPSVRRDAYRCVTPPSWSGEPPNRMRGAPVRCGGGEREESWAEKKTTERWSGRLSCPLVHRSRKPGHWATGCPAREKGTYAAPGRGRRSLPPIQWSPLAAWPGWGHVRVLECWPAVEGAGPSTRGAAMPARTDSAREMVIG